MVCNVCHNEQALFLNDFYGNSLKALFGMTSVIKVYKNCLRWFFWYKFVRIVSNDFCDNSL